MNAPNFNDDDCGGGDAGDAPEIDQNASFFRIEFMFLELFFMFISKQSSTIIQEIIKHTKKCIKWNVVHFYNINSQNLLNKNLHFEGFKSKFLVNIHIADFKDLTFKDFLLTLSKNTRSQYRKKWNRIEREGLVDFEIINTAEDYKKNVDEMNNLYRVELEKYNYE